LLFKALRLLFLQTHATSYSFFSALLYTVKEKGGKSDRKPHPLPYGLRNPFTNLKSGELSRLCPETSKKLYAHEFGFWLTHAAFFYHVYSSADYPGFLSPTTRTQQNLTRNWYTTSGLRKAPHGIDPTCFCIYRLNSFPCIFKGSGSLKSRNHLRLNIVPKRNG
jgi:hypothetical protein